MKKLNYLGFVLAVPVLLCTGSATAAVSPLTATTSPVSLTYQKPSTNSTAAVKVTVATGSLFFTVDPASVPIWLSLDAMNGTAVPTTGQTINFSSSAVCAGLSAGTYSASVKLQVTTGALDLAVPVTLVIKNTAAVLSIKEGITQTSNWALGSAIPLVTLTPLSSSDPIAYTAAVAVSAPTTPTWISINHANGLAYSNGSTPISVAFLPQVFAQAVPGDILVGTVTLTYAGGSPVVATFTITVTPPAAAITSLYPAATPLQATGTLTVVLTGSGFVASPTLQATVCTVATVTVTCTVVNSTTITIIVDATGNLEAAGPLAITAQNPNGGSPATASTINLSVTTAPIIYSIVNSGSYLQPTVPKLVPYEAISIFGDNFGASATVPLLGVLETKGRYPAILTPVTSQDIVVTFYNGATVIGTAPLLFATQTQINCLVPAGIAGISGLQVAVTFNGVEGNKIAATSATADPGIFTVESSGVGQGAILNVNGSVNSATNKAAKGSTVSIYLTGLGAPNSTAPSTTLTSLVYPASCLSTAAYMGSVNTLTPSPAWTSIDGAVLLASNIPANHFAPCFLTSGVGVIPVTVAITYTTTSTATPPVTTTTTAAAIVTYAGFVADSIAGLYQINATLPAAATGTATVVVSVGAAKSQSGVTLSIL